MRSAKSDVLAFTPFPFDQWRKVWSNNWLERLNKEIKRRTNVVGIFPSDPSALRLIGAVLADQHDEWVIARRYLSEASWRRSAPAGRLHSFSPASSRPPPEPTEKHVTNPTLLGTQSLFRRLTHRQVPELLTLGRTG